MKLLTPEHLAEIREWYSDMAIGVPDWYDLAGTLLEHITALEAERAGLVGYVTHNLHCGTEFAKCTCGLDELLKQESES